MSAMKLDYELNSKLVCLGLISFYFLFFYSLIKVGHIQENANLNKNNL